MSCFCKAPSPIRTHEHHSTHQTNEWTEDEDKAEAGVAATEDIGVAGEVGQALVDGAPPSLVPRAIRVVAATVEATVVAIEEDIEEETGEGTVAETGAASEEATVAGSGEVTVAEEGLVAVEVEEGGHRVRGRECDLGGKGNGGQG